MVFKRALSQTLATLIPFLNQAELRNVYNQATEIQDEMLRGEALGILTASGKLQTGNRHNMVDGAITAAANSRPSHTGVQDDPTYPTPIVESSADQSDIKFWERLFKQQDERIIKGAQALELQIGSQPLTTQDKTAIPNDVFSQRAINEPLIQWMIRLRPQLKALLSPKSLELIDDTLDATPASVHLSRVKEQVFRLGKLGILTVYAPYISDAKLCMEVEDSLDKENLADQLLLLENIVSVLSAEGDADEVLNNARRVKGAVLRGLLKLARRGPSGLNYAFQDLPKEFIREADLSIVLEYVLDLPTYVERNQFTWEMNGKTAERAFRFPLLEGLALIVAFLDKSLVSYALARVIEISDFAVREQVLTLLAPYSTAEQLDQALKLQRTIEDSFEQIRALGVVIPDLAEPERSAVREWQLTVASEIADGLQLGTVLTEMYAEEPDTGAEQIDHVLKKISNRSPNDRHDVLIILIRHWQGQVPRPLLESALQLPAVSDSRTYSWLMSIFPLIDRFPDDMLPALWNAACTLPPYLHIGDPEQTGWHWNYSYPFATALNALVPRLSDRLLYEAFEIAQSFYWKPREEIMQQIALRATGRLASLLLDHALTMLDAYHNPDLSTSLLYQTEGAMFTGEIEFFRAEREVACAEIIAAITPELDTVDIERSIASLKMFRNGGPRAWLPGKLLPHVNNQQQREILPAAIIAAMEFLSSEDPSRYDLLTALLPFYRRVTDDDARPLKQLISFYFPQHDELVLTQEELGQLSSEDHKRYKLLIKAYFSQEVMEDFQSVMMSGSSAEKRYMMEQVVVTPIYSQYIDQIVFDSLLRSEISPRINALGVLERELTPAQFRVIVSSTFEFLLPLRLQNLDQFTELIKGLIPFLDAQHHTHLLQIVSNLSEPHYELSQEDMEVSAHRKLLNALPNRPVFDIKNEPQAPINIFMSEYDQWMEILDIFKQLRSNRVDLLATMLPYLDTQLITQLVHTVLCLPERERVDAIFSIMPEVGDEYKAQMYENVLSMQWAFGRTWLLWHMNEHLTQQQRQRALPYALSAVHALRTAEGKVVALFGLLGLSTEEQQRELILRLIIDTLDELTHEKDLVHVLCLVVECGSSYKNLMILVAERLLQVHDIVLRDHALVVLAKVAQTDSDLAREYYDRIRVILVERLHNSMRLKRESFLRTIAQLWPAFQLNTQDSYLIACSIINVSNDWNWL